MGPLMNKADDKMMHLKLIQMKIVISLTISNNFIICEKQKKMEATIKHDANDIKGKYKSIIGEKKKKRKLNSHHWLVLKVYPLLTSLKYHAWIIPKFCLFSYAIWGDYFCMSIVGSINVCLTMILRWVH